MKIKIVFVDMDGTIVDYPHGEYGSSWDAVMYAANKQKQSKKFLDYYLPKPELYCEWHEKACALLKDVQVGVVEDAILPPSYSPGAKELFRGLKRNGIVRGILSSGTNPPAKYIEKDIDADFCFCNEFLQKDGVFTGIGLNRVPMWDKKLTLKEICQRYGICPDSKGIFKDAAMIGDSGNDIDVFKAVGTSIAFKPKDKKVADAADYVVEDLSHALEIIRNIT
ncbi:MAG: HAD family phosphatase [Candidatus Aenigmarchaeota archaeon]|nr:HAD family phosphatase [Candidatus Aenigmarchaeota archaeon]